ncbi:MAG: hypothetical protein JXX28_00220 [Deltaproteobacteria bacterium]|nr:hypothetical protein [Deltaproteobacteria bacterium]
MRSFTPPVPEGLASPPPSTFIGYTVSSPRRDTPHTNPHPEGQAPPIASRATRDLFNRVDFFRLQPIDKLVWEAEAALGTHTVRTLDAGSLRMDERGLITDDGPLPVERLALEDLLRHHPRTFRGGERMLLALDPSKRAEIFAYLTSRRPLRGQDRLLVRKGPGGADQAFAHVSDRYHVRAAPDILVLLRERWRANRDQRGAFFYNTTTSDWRLDMIQANRDHRFGKALILRGNDVGQGSLRLDTAALRFRCSNLQLVDIDAKTQTSWRLPHTASPELLDGLIAAALDLDNRVNIAPFQEAWERLRSMKVAANLGLSIEKLWEPLAMYLLEAMAMKGHYRNHGTLAKHLEEAWNMEPGDTLTSVLNAVTATHHLPISEERVSRLEASVPTLMREMLERPTQFLAPFLPRSQEPRQAEEGHAPTARPRAPSTRRDGPPDWR